MVTTQSIFVGAFPALQPSSPSLRRRNGRHSFSLISSSTSKKGDSPDDSDARRPPSFVLRVPNPSLARSAVLLFGLGFIDAGYSGDWSRIGAISQETEELLRLAAFVIVPLCLVLLFSIATEPE